MAPLATVDINADTVEYSEHSYECKASPKRPLVSPSPPSGQRTLAKKSVSFNRRVILSKTIHITAYTTDEVHACWYNGEEFYIMKTDARVTAQLIAEKSPVLLEDGAENVWCTRGLESFVQETRALKRNTRNLSRWAVLDEQEMQHLTTRTVDSERLARVYMSASASALEQARALGLDDELELMTIL